MSVLSPEQSLELATILAAVSNPDNNIRGQAEDTLNTVWLNQRPGLTLMALAEQARGNEDVTIRSTAAVVFRRMSSKTKKDVGGEARDLFMTLRAEERNPIRELFLQSFASEINPQVRNKVADAVAEIARQYFDTGEQWNELLQALFEASKSPDPVHREGAFKIFSTTPGIIQKQHAEAAKKVFQDGFSDEAVVVRIAAMEAFSAFFRSISKSQHSVFYSLLSPIMSVLPPLKNQDEAENLSKGFMTLIDLAEVSPRFFRLHFSDVVQFSMTVIQDKELGDQARQNALELMATFADNAPNMCKRDPNYTTQMVTQCLNMMTDIGLDDDDAQDWNESDDLDVDESDMNHVAGEQCMDRLANRLGGSQILPPTFTWLPRMMSSPDWRERHAALMAISAISEGCRDIMVDELSNVLNLVVPLMQDPHPRVRWAGCNALGQMSTDFAGTMQEKYHNIVMSSLIPVLSSPEARVQSHAAAALVNFCEEAEREILVPYLDALIQNLNSLLLSPKRYVQEQALSTIATIADSAEEAFATYYDNLMPRLFTVLSGEQSKEYRLLRAKAMECATLITLAVGKDKVGADARRLVEILAAVQGSIIDADDPQASYLLHCWGRMCRIMGDDFIPYLPLVIPRLIELASAKADIQLIDDEEQIAKVEQEEGWDLVPVRGKYIGIKTTVLEDKNTAIELLVVYAQQLQGAFAAYVQPIMQDIALPGLAFFFHDPVRQASAKLIPQLLNSVKKASPEIAQSQLAPLWAAACEKLLDVLRTEPLIETLSEVYQSFYESVECLGQNCLTANHMNTFVTATENNLSEYRKRVENRAAEEAANEDGEEESEDVLIAIEDDERLLSDINKTFHAIFKHHGSAFLPAWERLLPYYVMLISSTDATQRQFALCIFDDVLEFTPGTESVKYQNHFLKNFVESLSDFANASNLQAAAYGVGTAAKNGGGVYDDFVAAAIPPLFAICHRPEARSDDYVYATENACAAISKVLHFASNKIQDQQAVLNAWVSTLPVVNDEEAAPYAYGLVIQMIEAKSPAIINNMPHIIDSILAALEAQTIEGKTAERVVNAAKTLGNDLVTVVSSMSPERQELARKWFLSS